MFCTVKKLACLERDWSLFLSYGNLEPITWKLINLIIPICIIIVVYLVVRISRSQIGLFLTFLPFFPNAFLFRHPVPSKIHFWVPFRLFFSVDMQLEHTGNLFNRKYENQFFHGQEKQELLSMILFMNWLWIYSSSSQGA